jgi:aromatic ring-opening dioxygenase catalytic subunit (LigB family)
MPLVFAAAASHAPGITAWPDAPAPDVSATVWGAYHKLHDELAAAHVDALIMLTSEHWANFFLDHIGAFCVGRAEAFSGPVEPWLRVEKTAVPGEPALATSIIEAAYANGVEPSYAHELEFDHGTMVPLHFLTPQMNVPVVPVIFNTLAAPQPTAARCLAFGKIIGDVARASALRIGIVATGGMSHDPGERNHGIIDAEFDRRFLAQMSSGESAPLTQYSYADFQAAGAGAFELLSWIALRGAIGSAPGTVLGYEAAVAWATGCGFMTFDASAAAAAA